MPRMTNIRGIMRRFPNGLRPFFTYYGGKWRSAPRYPAPIHSIIIEPFAGSAGYSLRHYERNVLLIEKDERLAALWEYLIRVSPPEILALPDIPDGMTVDALNVSEEVKTLIGFWLNKGAASPCKTPSAWMRSGIRPKSYWGPEVREILARQAGEISHWRVMCGDYTLAPNFIEASWFIDPPYEKAGKHYRHSAINYQHLANWCRTRNGQVIVCENVGAEWLPFKEHIMAKSTPGSRGKGATAEAIWLS